nr:hypothetical protein [Tanacetum cinerariifolium]
MVAAMVEVEEEKEGSKLLVEEQGSSVKLLATNYDSTHTAGFKLLRTNHPSELRFVCLQWLLPKELGLNKMKSKS